MKNISYDKNFMDLRGTPCPKNFIRCRLALEQLNPKEELLVYLDKGEPEQMVIQGIRGCGHVVKVTDQENTWLKLLIICGE